MVWQAPAVAYAAVAPEEGGCGNGSSLGLGCTLLRSLDDRTSDALVVDSCRSALKRARRGTPRRCARGLRGDRARGLLVPEALRKGPRGGRRCHGCRRCRADAVERAHARSHRRYCQNGRRASAATRRSKGLALSPPGGTRTSAPSTATARSWRRSPPPCRAGWWRRAPGSHCLTCGEAVADRSALELLYCPSRRRRRRGARRRGHPAVAGRLFWCVQYFQISSRLTHFSCSARRSHLHMALRPS